MNPLSPNLAVPTRGTMMLPHLSAAFCILSIIQCAIMGMSEQFWWERRRRANNRDRKREKEEAADIARATGDKEVRMREVGELSAVLEAALAVSRQGRVQAPEWHDRERERWSAVSPLSRGRWNRAQVPYGARPRDWDARHDSHEPPVFSLTNDPPVHAQQFSTPHPLGVQPHVTNESHSYQDSSKHWIPSHPHPNPQIPPPKWHGTPTDQTPHEQPGSPVQPTTQQPAYEIRLQIFNNRNFYRQETTETKHPEIRIQFEPQTPVAVQAESDSWSRRVSRRSDYFESFSGAPLSYPCSADSQQQPQVWSQRQSYDRTQGVQTSFSRNVPDAPSPVSFAYPVWNRRTSYNSSISAGNMTPRSSMYSPTTARTSLSSLLEEEEIQEDQEQVEGLETQEADTPCQQCLHCRRTTLRRKMQQECQPRTQLSALAARFPRYVSLRSVQGSVAEAGVY